MGGCGEGWGPCACPDDIAIPLGFMRHVGVSSDEGQGTPKEAQPEEDKHEAPTSTLPNPLSLQDG